MKKSAKLPEICDDELRLVLMRHQVSYHCESKLKVIKNAFISYDGLVLKNFFLVLGCAFNLIGFKDKTFYFQFWKLTLEKYLVSKYGKSIPSIYIDDTVAVIHSKWFNYAFWINSYLPRLFDLIDSKENFKLLYPSHWDKMPFVKLVLDELPIEVIKIPQDHQVFAKKLLMPETRKWTASFDVLQIQKVRNNLIEISNTRVAINDFPKKIYLTRKNRGNRCAENENEVMEFLSKEGFQAIAFEEYSIWEQIKMMSEATHFISIHGAGLTNLIFLSRGAKVLELVNRQYAQKEYTFPFWKLAQTVDVDYYIQLCDAVNRSGELGYGKVNKNSNESDFLVNSNLIVDLIEIQNIIEKWDY